VDVKETEILRILPLLNDTLNDEWISDKARFSFDGLINQRIGNPFIKENSSFLKLFGWQKVLKTFNIKHKTFKPSEILFISGNTLDFETLKVLKEISQNLNINLI
jgi:NADH dehydrogenase/NADH:ubiquinone oxidoreductase subunit G